MKQILPVLFLFSFVVLYPKSTYATISISISNVPSAINVDQEFVVDVNFSCSSCGASYLRGVFFFPETSPIYSGYTQNNSGEWVNQPSSPSSFLKIDSGGWIGQMKFRFEASKLPGNYFFKVGRYTASGTSFSQVSENTAITVSNPSPEPATTSAVTATPTSSPTQSPTPTPTVAKSTYKINFVKDSDGASLSNIKIYVDGNYIHHYAPESIIFCPGCHCDDANSIDCSLGVHSIKLVKEGYADWSEQKTFVSGEYHEVNPILSKITTPTPTNSPTPTPVSTPTSTPTPSPTLTPTKSIVIAPLSASGGSDSAAISATESTVLGDSTNSAYPSAIMFTDEAESASHQAEIKIPKATPYKTIFLIGLGVASISGGLLYLRFKKG